MKFMQSTAFHAITLVFVLLVPMTALSLWAFSADVTSATYPEASNMTVYEGSGITFDVSNANKGYVMAKASRKKKLKLRVAKGGKNYTYDLHGDGRYETFPLQMDSGSYTMTVLEQVRGTQYAQVFSKKIKAALDDESGYTLYPNQYVHYDANGKAVAKSAELCANLTSDGDITKAVIGYVAGSVLYDHIKAKTVETGYLPDPDRTLEEMKGICFDYAALVACMLRVEGVKCKLVIGYADKFYHAWNEVLLDGEWTRYDTTSMASGLKIVQYTTERVY